MNPQSRNVFIGIVILIVLALLGYFAWKERQVSNSTSMTASSTPVMSTSTALTAPSSTPYTIKTIAPSTVSSPPNAAAPLVFSGSISSDEQASLQSEFATDVAALAKNKTDFNSWIDLGDVRKEAGDYSGAAADWQYVSELYPTNIVSFANLGDLYTNFLSDYPKAAAAYKQQIANDPTDVYIYMDLFDLYTGQYPQRSATAEAVLEQGIAANPKATDLQAALSTYEESQGR